MATKLPPQYPNSKDPNSFESGLAFQDFVVDSLREQLGIIITNYSSQKFQFGTGENKQGIEVKLDRDCTGTKRLSIEIAEKTKASNNSFVPSGIYRSDNSWLYIQGNWDIIFIFAKSILILLHKSKRYPEHEISTLRGYFLPLNDAKKYAAKYIELHPDQDKLQKWMKN
jgi:hypothetical protein